MPSGKAMKKLKDVFWSVSTPPQQCSCGTLSNLCREVLLPASPPEDIKHNGGDTGQHQRESKRPLCKELQGTGKSHIASVPKHKGWPPTDLEGHRV